MSTGRSCNEAHFREADARLRDTYPSTRLGNKEDPLDELIFVILSGKTQESTYCATFQALKERYPSWSEAHEASPEEIEAVIRFGGLAKKKSLAISRLLSAISERVGRVDLSWLMTLDDRTAYDFLCGLPGVGPKTARCVLVYSLNRPVFAVDTHVARIMYRLGCSRHRRLTDRVQERIEALVPPDIRFSLHVNLVLHGRSICTAQWPQCGACVLADLCPSAFMVDSRKEEPSDASKR